MAESERWDGNASTLQNEAERDYLLRTIDSFYQYRKQAHFNLTHRRRQEFYALPRHHVDMLNAAPFNMRERFNAIDEAIDRNAAIAMGIFRHALKTFGFDDVQDDYMNQPWRIPCTAENVTKASTIVNQMYRDWSAEGARERDAHFKPVMEQLGQEFPVSDERFDIKVLVPGAGLGRLVYEISNAGFRVEGNEISFHALLASNWILNGVLPDQTYPLHPFLTRHSNNPNTETQLEKVIIPDIHPGTTLEFNRINAEPAPGEMSMSASDFLTAYQQEDQKEQFDAVATVFFIDTAPNVLRYIEAIRHTLKPGGRWINLGPLQWHFEDTSSTLDAQDMPTGRIPGIEEPGRVELNKEDIMLLVQKMGFAVVEFNMELKPAVGYIEQHKSMWQSTYRLLHFVAYKLPV